MPFTLAHAAAALPFRRFKPVWPALVIGTFAPDFEYFLRVSDESHTGHQFPGVLIFTLPSAVLVVWLFESYVKRPAIELLPASLRRRLQDRTQSLSFTRLRTVLAVVGWAAIGVATHLLWDSLTHNPSWPSEHWAWLSQPVAVPWHAPVTVSKLLQYVSSLFGIVVLTAWLVLWYIRTTPAAESRAHELSPWRKMTAVFMISGIALIGGDRIAQVRLQEGPRVSSMNALATGIEATTLVFCAEMLLYGVVRTYTTKTRTASLLVS